MEINILNSKVDILLNSIKLAGIDFVVGLPCINFKDMINSIETDNNMKYISITREEEGVGICSGLWIGGKKSILLLQNSGLGNSINGIMSLNKLYGIPLILLISLRGVENEKMIGQIPMGNITYDLLNLMEIEYYELSKTKLINLKSIINFIDDAFINYKTVAILVKPSYWI